MRDPNDEDAKRSQVAQQLVLIILTSLPILSTPDTLLLIVKCIFTHHFFSDTVDDNIEKINNYLL